MYENITIETFYISSCIITKSGFTAKLKYFRGHLTRPKVGLTSTARWQRQPFIVLVSEPEEVNLEQAAKRSVLTKGEMKSWRSPLCPLLNGAN